MPTTADLLAQAWRQHQAGNLAAAEPLYRQVLAAEPQSLDAHFLLGFLCQTQGRFPESGPIIAATCSSSRTARKCGTPSAWSSALSSRTAKP